jgi:hypothetical protein
MQKVVGSNPISRFFANALHVGGLGAAREPRINWNHPRISPTFQALLQISAWNDPDEQRLAPIPEVPSMLALLSARCVSVRVFVDDS